MPITSRILGRRMELCVDFSVLVTSRLQGTRRERAT